MGNNVALRGVHTGVPSFFKGWCREASRPGGLGYEVVGYQLAKLAGHEIPLDVEEDEWIDAVEALERLLSQSDDQGTLAWFDLHYPKMMNLIPSKRRASFMNGVRRAFTEGEIAA